MVRLTWSNLVKYTILLDEYWTINEVLYESLSVETSLSSRCNPNQDGMWTQNLSSMMCDTLA